MARRWVFVRGHRRAVAREIADDSVPGWVRMLPDGTPMWADGPRDSINKALERHKAKESAAKRGPGRPRKEIDDDDA